MVNNLGNLGLDDILEDNAYVPSFAPKETKKN